MTAFNSARRRAGLLGTASLLALSASLALGCEKTDAPKPQLETAKASAKPSSAKKPEAKHAAMAKPASAAAPAELGKPAPDFTLKGVDGKEVKLSQFKGSTVVLEWFNPGCPFVKASHTEGSLKTLAKEHAKDVVWLAINSGGAGKQGNGMEANKKGLAIFGMEYPLLIDESGEVGRMYGAATTPHMFVINPEGVLVYRGAIDNSPDGEGKSPKGGELVNYVENALTAIKAGKAVEPAETKSYGCSVKYSDS